MDALSSLQLSNEWEVLSARTKAGRLRPASLTTAQQGLTFFRVVNEFGHQVLNVCHERGQHDNVILVGRPVMQRIDEGRREDAVFDTPQFKRLLSLRRRG